MPCTAERCVHEYVLCFEFECFEALGEQDRCMPIFACHSAHALRLAVEQRQVGFRIDLLVALRVPDLEVARVAYQHDVFVDARRLAQLA